ncbi:unnamed protein product [Symbiodinium natans]|uniref:Uncharacterized protein n=1 Tax=Symbiodinium natans TaxID=878477 RepID=A0A812QZI7_9DINO|nr:unnamed protein product [Symbiodinium natans]
MGALLLESVPPHVLFPREAPHESRAPWTLSILAASCSFCIFCLSSGKACIVPLAVLDVGPRALSDSADGYVQVMRAKRRLRRHLLPYQDVTGTCKLQRRCCGRQKLKSRARGKTPEILGFGLNILTSPAVQKEFETQATLLQECSAQVQRRWLASVLLGAAHTQRTLYQHLRDGVRTRRR